MALVANGLIWAIVVAATAGVIARPFKLPEAIWALAGAVLLVILGLLPAAAAAKAIGKGTDVYLFLTGMMLLSETARREGVFDWAAAFAVTAAKSSPKRLFLLIYLVGVVVTAFLSNDATAVVLTPAVYAAARKAKVEPLPYLFICAFIANAASFILPISNPANIVLYGDHTPPLGRWLASFTLPSVLSVAATYVLLRWVEGRKLEKTCEGGVERPKLSVGGWTCLGGIGSTAAVLLTVSAIDKPLGLATCIMGLLTTASVLILTRASPLAVFKGVSWAILPLVGGLFVLVEAIDRTGWIDLLARHLQQASKSSELLAAAGAGSIIAAGSNLMNNLPAGLISSTVIIQAHAPRRVVDALLIGVDLGPNLSITGSLATILWLTALRREGVTVGFLRFLKLGVVVMPPALALALAARFMLP